MTDQNTIHLATLIRLQIAITALQVASGPVADVRVNLRGMARRDPENTLLAEVAASLDGLSETMSAALQIAFGARNDIPAELQTAVFALRMEVDVTEAERVLTLVTAHPTRKS